MSVHPGQQLNCSLSAGTRFSGFAAVSTADRGTHPRDADPRCCSADTGSSICLPVWILKGRIGVAKHRELRLVFSSLRGDADAMSSSRIRDRTGILTFSELLDPGLHRVAVGLACGPPPPAGAAGGTAATYHMGARCVD